MSNHQANPNLALLAVIIFMVAAGAPLLASPAAGSQSVPDLNTILDCMERAQAAARMQAPAYSVTRAYKFFGGDSRSPNAEVVAKVDFRPPAKKSFNIEQSRGSERGAKIVRRVLEHESRQAAHLDSGAISRAHYNFAYLREEPLDGKPAYVLAITPKRADWDFIDGQIWVDADSFLVRRIEGDLSKSPSWWLKDVHVILSYGRVAGIWLQTAAQAVANVRFFGRHTMLAQAVSCRPEYARAQHRPSHAGFSRRSSSATLATGVLRP